MFKVRRGDMPADVPHIPYPSGQSVSQGGFEQGNIGGGNLRDHDGKKAVESAIKATTHYAGDYGTSLGKKNVRPK